MTATDRDRSPTFEGRPFHQPSEPLFDQGLSFDVETLLSRRSVIKALGLGGVSAGLFVACGPGASTASEGSPQPSVSGSSTVTAGASSAAADQQNHAVLAVRTGIAIVAAARDVAASHPGWPTFRVGVNTGPAVVGTVGAEDRRSFAVIGDTTNTAARLMAVGAPGQVVVSRATWDALGPDRQGVALGAATVKGRREPVDAWLVTAAG